MQDIEADKKNINLNTSWKWLFGALILLLTATAGLGYLVNSEIYFVVLFATPLILSIAYVMIWRTPKMEAIKVLCIVLAVEGIPLLAITGYLIIPLAIIYLANRKRTNRKRGVVIACLVFGILYVLASFVTK